MVAHNGSTHDGIDRRPEGEDIQDGDGHHWEIDDEEPPADAEALDSVEVIADEEPPEGDAPPARDRSPQWPTAVANSTTDAYELIRKWRQLLGGAVQEGPAEAAGSMKAINAEGYVRIYEYGRTLEANELISFMNAFGKFVALVHAEVSHIIERVQWVAREGEDADLLLVQTGIQLLGDECLLVQTRSLPLLDDAFHQALRELQQSLEDTTEDIAAIRAQKLGRRLGTWRASPLGPEGHGHNRVAQLGAVLAAFEPARLVPETDVCASEEDERWSEDWWHLLYKYISVRAFPIDADQRTGASSSNTAQVQVVDSLTETDTQQEGRDDDVREARREREILSQESAADEEVRIARWRAASHQDWEDWTVHQAMQDPPRNRKKKQKLYVQAETKEGRLLWRAATRVTMQPEEEMQVRISFGPPDVAPQSQSSSSSASMEQLEVDFDEMEQEIEAQDAEVLQVASQVDPGVLSMPPEPGYDTLEDLYNNILETKNGRAWFIAWKEGRVNDLQVDQRFGAVVLQNFQAQWQQEHRPSSQRQEGASAVTSGDADRGDMNVDLSAPTQLVPQLAAAVPAAEVAPAMPSTSGLTSADVEVLPVPPGDVESSAVSALSGLGVVEAGLDVLHAGNSVGTSHANEETIMDDDILEEDLTIPDHSTWTGRALDRWQREGHL